MSDSTDIFSHVLFVIFIPIPDPSKVRFRSCKFLEVSVGWEGITGFPNCFIFTLLTSVIGGEHPNLLFSP